MAYRTGRPHSFTSTPLRHSLPAAKTPPWYSSSSRSASSICKANGILEPPNGRLMMRKIASPLSGNAPTANHSRSWKLYLPATSQYCLRHHVFHLPSITLFVFSSRLLPRSNITCDCNLTPVPTTLICVVLFACLAYGLLRTISRERSRSFRKLVLISASALVCVASQSAVNLLINAP